MVHYLNRFRKDTSGSIFCSFRDLGFALRLTWIREQKFSPMQWNALRAEISFSILSMFV